MSDPKDAGAELLEKVRRELARNQHAPSGPLYRVVEVGRDPNGRLVRHAKIWNADLDAVRRFGRALAANSVAQHVSIGDSAGATLEEIQPPPAGVMPPGWQGWRDVPLPSLPRPRPPRPKPAWLVAAQAEPPHPATPPARAAAQPPRDLPVLAAATPAPAEPPAADPKTTLARAAQAGGQPPAKPDDVAIELP